MLRLRAEVALRPGDPAPAFRVTTVDGETIAVPGDFEGEGLPLGFGTPRDRQSASRITRLDDVRGRFGDDPRFAVPSLTRTADDAETREYVADEGEAWPHAIVGHFPNPIAWAYGVHDEDVHASIAIGPDGRLFATGLSHDGIGKAVGEALGRE